MLTPGVANVAAVDATTGKVLSGIFLNDVQATSGQTLMLDFDFATAHPFDRSIDIRIGRLRRKIEPDPAHPRYLLTQRGRGYKLSSRPMDARSDDDASV